MVIGKIMINKLICLPQICLNSKKGIRTCSIFGQTCPHSYEAGPLSGIRILDMTRILAGPFATMILGDLGAEVIKIEKPETGDDTRQWGPPFVGKESCYFISVNRNKKSVVVDMKKPEGNKLIRDLAKKSDVLVENFVPGVLEKVRLDYISLKTEAPHLIYCSLTGYGSSGPYKNRAGLDVLAASIGGLVDVTGPEGGEPCKVGVAMTDLATGLYLHGAIMAAILQRQKTNVGQKIHCDLLSTQISCMVNLASNYINKGILSKRRGTAHESIVPYQAFPTTDGYICIGAVNNLSFHNLCQYLSLDNLSDDPKYKTNALRVKNRTKLLNILAGTFKLKTTKQWLKILKNAPFPYGPINNLGEVFNDPQVNHNQMVQEIYHTKEGNVKVVGPAVKYSSSDNRVRSAPPFLGEHTREVLKDVLSLSDYDVDHLIKERIVEAN